MDKIIEIGEDILADLLEIEVQIDPAVKAETASYLNRLLRRPAMVKKVPAYAASRDMVLFLNKANWPMRLNIFDPTSSETLIIDVSRILTKGRGDSKQSV